VAMKFLLRPHAKAGGLSAHGGHFRRASLRYVRLANCMPPGAGDPSRSANRAVFQSAAATAGESPAGSRRRSNPRSGDGEGDREPRHRLAQRSGWPSEWELPE
jgi:hypothetical protein